MKSYFFQIAMCVVLCMGMLACTSDDEENASMQIPDGALPSGTLIPNSLPDEPYASDAISIKVVDGYDAPFTYLELLGDGHYLLSYYDYYYSQSRDVRGENAQSYILRKSTSANCQNPLSRVSQTNNGLEYGKYEVTGEKVYILENGYEVDLGEISNAGTLRYRNPNGTTWSTVYVDATKTNPDEATRSLCHGWNLNSFECWIYLNNYYLAHGKQVISNGKCVNYFKVLGNDLFDISEEEYLGDESTVAYYVYFGTNGVYICYFLDGSIDFRNWRWRSAEEGIIEYYDYDGSAGFTYGGFASVRFAGSQMRIYEDYTEYDDACTARLIAVNTLTVDR